LTHLNGIAVQYRHPEKPSKEMSDGRSEPEEDNVIYAMIAGSIGALKI